MKTFVSFAFAAMLAVLVMAAPSSASTVSECKAQIAALSSATSAAAFNTDNQSLKTQSQLVFHLQKASTALDKGENRDALKQLTDYASDLADAVAAGRISTEAAAPLASAASNVVACIQGIQ